MPDRVEASPPGWYRVVSVLAIVWMLVGVSAWFMDLLMDESALAAMTEGQRQLYATRPAWLFAVYGVAVFSGLAGAVALLLRKGWAVPSLALSLVALTLQFGYTFLVMDAIGHIGAAAAIPFPATIFVIGAALLWLALTAAKRGWISNGPRVLTGAQAHVSR